MLNESTIKRLQELANIKIKDKFDAQDAYKAAARANIDLANFDINQVVKGMNIELEHGKAAGKLNVTDDGAVQTLKIALVHLKEIPDYNDKLEKMELQKENDFSEAEGRGYKVKLADIIEDATEIMNAIKDTDELPSWIQDKITLSQHNMAAVLEFQKSMKGASLVKN